MLYTFSELKSLSKSIQFHAASYDPMKAKANEAWGKFAKAIGKSQYSAKLGNKDESAIQHKNPSKKRVTYIRDPKTGKLEAYAFNDSDTVEYSNTFGKIAPSSNANVEAAVNRYKVARASMNSKDHPSWGSSKKPKPVMLKNPDTGKLEPYYLSEDDRPKDPYKSLDKSIASEKRKPKNLIKVGSVTNSIQFSDDFDNKLNNFINLLSGTSQNRHYKYGNQRGYELSRNRYNNLMRELDEQETAGHKEALKNAKIGTSIRLGAIANGTPLISSDIINTNKAIKDATAVTDLINSQRKQVQDALVMGGFKLDDKGNFIKDQDPYKYN